jgi:glutathione S-transferase
MTTSITTTALPVVLYGFQRSTYVNVARLLLHVKGVPFTFYDTEEEMYAEKHLQRHPFGRVPALQHGDFRVYETTAIAMYIEENFDGPRLMPIDVRKRAIAHQWMSNLNAYFYPYIVYYLVHERLVFGELGIPADEAVVAEALPKIERCLQVMTATLETSEYLADEVATMADYFLLPTMTALSFTAEGKSLLERFPKIVAWLERMGRLPTVIAFRATVPPRAPIEHARRWATEHRPTAKPLLSAVE